MAFMRPTAEHLTMYHVDTLEGGTEYVPRDVCGTLGMRAETFESDCLQLRPYLEGHRVTEIEQRTGWYGRLSAAGFLDCTSWLGPYNSRRLALEAVKDEFECDDNGDFPDDDGKEDYTQGLEVLGV
jgi:hypothetical protein